MKKWSLCFSFLILGLLNIVQSQNSKTSNIDSGGYSLEIFAAPGYHYRVLNKPKPVDTLAKIWDSVANARNRQESGRFSYSAGISINQHYSRKFHLQSGLWYSRKTYRNTRKNNFDTSILTRKESVFKAHYLEIPVNFKLRFVNNDKWQLWFKPGILNQFVLGAGFSQTKHFKDGSQSEISGNLFSSMTFFNFSIHGSFDFQFHLSKKWDLVVSPYGKFMVGPARELSLSENFYSYGLALGANYQF